MADQSTSTTPEIVARKYGPESPLSAEIRAERDARMARTDIGYRMSAEELERLSASGDCDIVDAELIDHNLGSGDDFIGIYQYTCANGFSGRVATTNADPVWEEQDEAAFAELLTTTEGLSTYEESDAELCWCGAVATTESMPVVEGGAGSLVRYGDAEPCCQGCSDIAAAYPVGVRCECAAAIGDGDCEAEPRPAAEMVSVQAVPPYLRGTHDAAGGAGCWRTFSLCPECWEHIQSTLAEDGDGDYWQGPDDDED